MAKRTNSRDPEKERFWRLCQGEHKRKNWLFFGSDRGGQTAAVLTSFIASCKRHGIDLFAYLRDVLTHIAVTPISQLSGLTKVFSGRDEFTDEWAWIKLVLDEWSHPCPRRCSFGR